MTSVPLAAPDATIRPSGWIATLLQDSLPAPLSALGMPPIVEDGVARRTSIPVVIDRTTGVTIAPELPDVDVHPFIRRAFIDGAGDDVLLCLQPRDPLVEHWASIAHLD